MGYQLDTQVVTFPLSGTVSEPLAFKNGDLLAVWVATVTSGSMIIRRASNLRSRRSLHRRPGQRSM